MAISRVMLRGKIMYFTSGRYFQVRQWAREVDGKPDLTDIQWTVDYKEHDKPLSAYRAIRGTLRAAFGELRLHLKLKNSPDLAAIDKRVRKPSRMAPHLQKANDEMIRQTILAKERLSRGGQ